MKIATATYSGAGNDFVMIDHRIPSLQFTPSFITALCSETDGAIFLEESKRGDYRMRIFNRDGSEAEMCGNGLRCFVKFLEELGLKQRSYLIETGAGILKTFLQEGEVIIEMSPPAHLQLDLPLELSYGRVCVHFLNTGVPHTVVFVPSVETIDVQKWGEEIRHHSAFAPAGTNVNFVSLHTEGSIKVRTFERGVEAETLACGTGATASALIASLKFALASPVLVEVRSKETLTITFQKEGERFWGVHLQGPAKKISQGSLIL